MSSCALLPCPPASRARDGGWNWIIVLGAVGLCLVLPLSVAGAQACLMDDPPCPPNQAPVVGVVHSQSSVQQRDVEVTVDFSDDERVDNYARNIWHNGAEVSSQFTFSPLNLSPSASTTAIGTVQLIAGTNTIRARICDTGSPALCTEETVELTYTPPPPAPLQAAPTLSLEPHGNDARILAGCAGCAAATQSYATPAYFSLDAPRSVALFYSSEQARPTGFIQVDAALHTQQVPTRLSIQVRQVGGGFMTLTNGTTEAYFIGDTGTVRLAAQFDAAHLSTGAYLFDVIVRSWWSSGAPVLESSIQARVLIGNEQNSIYGAGWTIAGSQRFHSALDGSGVVLATGDGGLQFFRLISCSPTPDDCTYESPAGDFSSLRKHPPNPSLGNTVWTRTFRDGSVAEFHGDGTIRFVRDRFQNETRVDYQAATDGPRIWRVVDPIGKITELSYESADGVFKAGSLRFITLPDARQSAFEVDQGGGDLRAIRDPDGVTAFQGTYQSHRLMTWRGRNNAEFGQTYDAFGQLSEVLTPAVATRDFGSVRVATSIQSVQATVLPLVGQGTSLPDGDARLVTRPESAWTRVTHPNGASTRTLAHRSGAPLQVEERDALGKTLVTTWRYNPSHQLLRHTSPTSGTNAYEWAGAQLREMTDAAAGTWTAFAYDAYDQIDSIRVNGVRRVKQYFSNARLAPDSVRTDTSSVTRYTYDSRGRVLSARDPASHMTTMVYESTGSQNTQSVSSSSTGTPTRTTSFTHDPSGRRREVTDPALRIFTSERDRMNRDTLSIALENTRTRFTHGDATGVYTVVDAKGQVYRDSVNALGWIVTRTDPRGMAERFAYDRQGNVVTYTNRKGNTVTATYDALDRPLTRVANGITTTFAYDTAGRWSAASNPESTDTLFADGSGRLGRAIAVRSGQRYATGYSYFNTGLPSRVTVEAQATGGGVQWGPRTVTVGYDTAQRLDYLQDFGGKAASIEYDQEHLPKKITLPTSTTASQRVQHTLVYTSTHRARGESYTQGLQSALGRSYEGYDMLDRVGSISRQEYPATLRRDVDYDLLGRLHSYTDGSYWSEEFWRCPDIEVDDCYDGYWETISHDEVLRSATFAYDAVGNRTDLGAVVDTGNRVTAFDGYALTYDADGFLTGKTMSGGLDRQLFWNDLGQLTRVVSNGVETTYGYDGWGRRVRKTANGVVTGYLYNGDQVVIEVDALKQPVVEYTYYAGIDRPNSMRRGGQTYYYAQDALGNVTGLIGPTGTLAARYEYTPFGETITATGSVTNAVQFKGREYDAESGLYFMRARYYDPHMGRFVSEDPAKLAGGINQYAFAGNNPIGQRDPSGTVCEVISEGVDEKLVCTDVGPGDYRTIRKYLGGEVGANAFRFFENLGLTSWTLGRSGSCRRGFVLEECDQLAEAMSDLVLNRDRLCSQLGVASTRRFQRGLYDKHDAIFNRKGEPAFGISYAQFPAPWGKNQRVGLAPQAFDRGETSNTIAHEEYHYRRPYARDSEVIAVGNRCAGPV